MNTSTKIVTAIFFLLPMPAFAATALVNIDTYGEEINALEATLVLPEGVYVSRIETGNSVVLFWVEAPKLTGNTMTFSGITPGGFSGVRKVLAIHGVFDAEALQQAYFENVTALKNDGAGERTPVALSLGMASFRADSAPPEAFAPTIASDPNVFDGKYFLVFATQDKGSGIKRYEVREGHFGWFRKAESPYLLTRQKLDRDIYIKAIDHTGNERVIVVPAVHSGWWERYALFAILIVLIVAAVIHKKVWVRFIK